MPIYSIWRAPDGMPTLVRGTDPPRCSGDEGHGHGCVRLHQFEADGLQEAVKVLHAWHEQGARKA